MPLRILVADDLADSADSLALLLRASGHEVRTAYDGVEALEEAARFLPNAVLLDLGMPGMDGIDVCKCIRAQPWGKEMFVVAQTGWGRADDIHRTREAGFDLHMTKPIDFCELASTLHVLEAPDSAAPGPR
jgi:CheY-like chemotaxis protein